MYKLGHRALLLVALSCAFFVTWKEGLSGWLQRSYFRPQSEFCASNGDVSGRSLRQIYYAQA